jgi:voltage-gated sodium channel
MNMSRLKNLFLNEKFILGVILVNSVIIFLQASGVDNFWTQLIDVVCTLIFIIEMGVKHAELGLKGYWSVGWNRLDGILVILSIPSLVAVFLPTEILDLSFLMILRILRTLRFLRVLHFFPNFDQILKGFKLALSQSYGILICFLVLIILFGLINCSLFGNIAPLYFGTPLRAIYSVFRICTIEGWYDIPDAIAATTSPWVSTLVRIYFCFLLLMGGIIGMSFINSIFVDAMVADNNDDVKAKLDELEQKIDRLLEEKESQK